MCGDVSGVRCGEYYKWVVRSSRGFRDFFWVDFRWIFVRYLFVVKVIFDGEWCCYFVVNFFSDVCDVLIWWLWWLWLNVWVFVGGKVELCSRVSSVDFFGRRFGRICCVYEFWWDFDYFFVIFLLNVEFFISYDWFGVFVICWVVCVRDVDRWYCFVYFEFKSGWYCIVFYWYGVYVSCIFFFWFFVFVRIVWFIECDGLKVVLRVVFKRCLRGRKRFCVCIVFVFDVSVC